MNDRKKTSALYAESDSLLYFHFLTLCIYICRWAFVPWTHMLPYHPYCCGILEHHSQHPQNLVVRQNVSKMLCLHLNFSTIEWKVRVESCLWCSLGVFWLDSLEGVSMCGQEYKVLYFERVNVWIVSPCMVKIPYFCTTAVYNAGVYKYTWNKAGDDDNVRNKWESVEVQR